MRKEYANLKMCDGTPIRELVKTEAEYQSVRKYMVEYGFSAEESIKKVEENRKTIKYLKTQKSKNDIEKLKIQLERARKQYDRIEYQNNVYFNLVCQIEGIVYDDFLTDKAKINKLKKNLKKIQNFQK